MDDEREGLERLPGTLHSALQELRRWRSPPPLVHEPSRQLQATGVMLDDAVLAIGEIHELVELLREMLEL